MSQPEFAGKTTEEVLTTLIKNESLWLQNAARDGWQNMDLSKIPTTIKDVIIGYKDVIVPGQPIPYTVDVVNQKALMDAVTSGFIAGAGISAADTLHEAAHQTKKRDPGHFDEKNPSYSEGTTIMDIIEEQQRILNKQREAELDDEVR